MKSLIGVKEHFCLNIVELALDKYKTSSGRSGQCELNQGLQDLICAKLKSYCTNHIPWGICVPIDIHMYKYIHVTRINA